MKNYSTEQITQKLKRKYKIKHILGYIFYTIIIIALIISIYIFIQKKQNSQNATNVLGIKAFSVSSGSMEPTLKIGDLIITKNIKEKNIKIGDIITFKEEGYIVTHRVVDIVNEKGKIKYKTKGDNNNTKDEQLVSYQNIEGVLVFKFPIIGKIVTKAQSTKGIIVIVIICYLIYKIVTIKEDRKQYRHDKRMKLQEEKMK